MYKSPKLTFQVTLSEWPWTPLSLSWGPQGTQRCINPDTSKFDQFDLFSNAYGWDLCYFRDLTPTKIGLALGPATSPPFRISTPDHL